MRSVFLVLSCAGAMIINVSDACLKEVCPRGVDLVLDCERHFRFYRPSNHWSRVGDQRGFAMAPFFIFPHGGMSFE